MMYTEYGRKCIPRDLLDQVDLHYGQINYELRVFKERKDTDLIQYMVFQNQKPENNYSRYQNCKSKYSVPNISQRIIWLRSVPASLISHMADGSLNPRKRH